ncbi:hypothetical protein A2303_02040 [Candidatus Falkowbacteria bacterium RIFOXYB2_FULL_47_14]|uniref:Uncharacterized protein n=1 Tax=Candidatus Falkowbacteria bacterium RIFOXYA2_FULL_47_19 TaxID=1797994 RepID=A0A1F5SN84_9BACT|nr:MAG: hypothetical protein A2227_06650 [Candidatus Falkowbacteria bacterium RIFOXYA2_FULL_47_19]OGF34613.1 MAG: hypothetical protein A2468_07945 [Candidatus Falkowbacteria bacterium RIFOXYC2_FULL_46_15]OGF43232.1 MAG: hypothetical protein A2303_02040 [Candidatus Falkowbacteria bacterium RIFOXYB2_FULL_47_14]
MEFINKIFKHLNKSSKPNYDSMIAHCPYCDQIISPYPTRGKKCTNCNKKYRVRKFPNEEVPRIIKEEDVPALEDLWAKQHYIKEAGNDDLQLIEQDEIDKTIAQAKRAFKNGKSDEAWGLYNQAILKVAQGKYSGGQAFLSKQWFVYRAMAIQLMAEEKYVNATEMFLRVAIIDVISYSDKKDNFTAYIAPVTLEIIAEAIDRGKIKKDKFIDLMNRSIEVSENTIGVAKRIDKVELGKLDLMDLGIKDFKKDLFKQQISNYFFK